MSAERTTGGWTCTWEVLHRLQHWRYMLPGRPRLEPCGRACDQGGRCKRHTRPAPPRPEMPLLFPYRYHWNRMDRKDQPCRVVARGLRLNTIQIEFEDGYQAFTSGNSLRRRVPKPRTK